MLTETFISSFICFKKQGHSNLRIFLSLCITEVIITMLKCYRQLGLHPRKIILLRTPRLINQCQFFSLLCLQHLCQDTVKDALFMNEKQRDM